MAYCVLAGLLTILCITAPYADRPLAPIGAFTPVYGTTMVIADLIIAALLFAQFWIVRWTWLLLLGSGFFFTALIFVPYALTFPGAFTPSGLLGAGQQTAGWLAVFWHLCSPIILINAILVRGSRAAIDVFQRSPSLAIVLSTALITAVVCGLTWALVANDPVLPRIYVYHVQQHHNLNLLLPILALDVIAAALLWVRGRSVVDLWLMVMCWTWAFELALAGILGGRYDLGWYTGRTFEMVAALTVLVLFLSEKTALYANLARASMQRRGARHARQIAMDAMAASIGHEIKQPLTAMITNASAGVRQASQAEPDMKEVQATFSDIVVEGQRIKEIIGGVRTMFKKSDHDRQLLDVNRIIRDVLTTVELDAALQRVTVKTDLDNDLPPGLVDSGQLHQVFVNLVTNALEAMSPVAGRPSVLTVRSGIVAGTSDIAVTVEDTGVGIADTGRIFEPFFSTKSTGSGIGLTVCQVIIEGHGGSLQVSANKPYGTIFRVILPTGDA